MDEALLCKAFEFMGSIVEGALVYSKLFLLGLYWFAPSTRS
jgi:hypothetical protein